VVSVTTDSSDNNWRIDSIIMTNGEILSGQHAGWTLLEKVAEGDAGEIYRVEAQGDGRRAILKRPARSAFSGDIARQAAQIANEGKILKVLHPFLAAQKDLKVGVPALLDQSLTSNERGENQFIVIEPAAGIDLRLMTRLKTLGRGSLPAHLTPADGSFLSSLGDSGLVPERILLSALHSLLVVLEQIHTQSFEVDGVEKGGILWNDVKPDHLFWDPRRSMLTIIDWGNGQFLESDGATADRQFSILDDYRQFGEEIGRFLAVAAPDLHARLNWPEKFTPTTLDSDQIEVIKERLLAELNSSGRSLENAHRREAELLLPGANYEDHLAQLNEVQAAIASSGEVPDYPGALRFCHTHAVQLIETDQLNALRTLCDYAIRLPEANVEAWKLAARIAQIAGRSEGQPRQCFLNSLQALMASDWETVLWNLLAAVQNAPEPDWWYDLTTQVRRRMVDLGPDVVTPLVSVKRVLLTLQSMAIQMEDRQPRAGASVRSTSAAASSEPADPRYVTIQSLSAQLKEDIIPNWMRTDPNPPFASISYADIDGLMLDIGAILPDGQQSIGRALTQARVQVSLVLDAWNRKEFVIASKALRQVMLWDPDRRRLLRAEQALLAAPGWLKKVHLGPPRGVTLEDFITDLEFEGRDLRNTVGPAAWLDMILEGCKKLRRGTWPTELIASSPAFLREMPWLKKFHRAEPSPEIQIPDDPEAKNRRPAVPPTLVGAVEGRLGKGQSLQLLEPLDTWVPEARGSSARVYLGRFPAKKGHPNHAAIKLMRMDHIDYALPLFHEEALVLTRMADVPGVTPLVECGFIRFDEGAVLPSDREHISADGMTGTILRLGIDEVDSFVGLLEAKAIGGWVPYLAIEKQDQAHSLLHFCDAGTTRGRFWPLTDLLRMSVQICDIIEAAHNRKIVYRDHKILHYYWLEDHNGVYMIDWNVARLHSEDLRDVEKQMDLTQFGARALHHILTGRTAPGALPMGPTRPEEIEAAATTYTPQWTYDDRRLPQNLKDVIERVLSGSYSSAAALRDDLKRCYLELPNGG
jgi:serine/threonine protein kinase